MSPTCAARAHARTRTRRFAPPVRGSYLITGVEADDGRVEVPADTDAPLAFLRRTLAEQQEEEGATGGGDGDGRGVAPLELSLRGTRFRIMTEDGSAMARAAFDALRAPCRVVLVSVEHLRGGGSNCGNDHVAAVNLTRPLPSEAGGAGGSLMALPDAAEVGEGLSAARRKWGGAAVEALQIEHFYGGPVDEGEIKCCVVLGGAGAGWTVVPDFPSAVRLALSRAASAAGGVCGGQTVRLRGLQARADLNGELGLALRFDGAAARWLVRLRNGEGKRVKAANLEPLEGGGGRLFVFWGNAAWSRTQLLGEIARGHWGLCKASVSDVTLPVAERWAGLEGRLAFAPITAMTEDFVAEAQQQMEAVRGMAAHAAEAPLQEQQEQQQQQQQQQQPAAASAAADAGAADA
jgi:hypothetical protein